LSYSILHTYIYISYITGLVISSIVHKTNEKETYERIVEDITAQEIEFMKMFEIDDGDGTIDHNEFTILTVIRIGATPPDLISKINERFKQLDRLHTGYLTYDDIVFGRKRRRQSKGTHGMGFLSSTMGKMKSWTRSDR
jgi:hypothetical protein